MERLGDVLHHEIEQLPEKYRKAIVLCELEGLTEGQAAQRLEWPVGTVHTRLRRGRNDARPPLAAVWAHGRIPGARSGLQSRRPYRCRQSWRKSTIEAVVQPGTTKTVPAAVSALTAAVCRAMFLTKLTISLVALLVVGTASLMAVQTLTFTRAKPKPIGSATRTTSGEPRRSRTLRSPVRRRISRCRHRLWKFLPSSMNPSTWCFPERRHSTMF